MRSIGKLTEVAMVPCGVDESVEVASGADWAHAAVAITSNSNNNPVFFMLPPGRDALRAHPQSDAVEIKLQMDGNKGVRGGQGYEGVSQVRKQIFRAKCESAVASGIRPL